MNVTFRTVTRSWIFNCCRINWKTYNSDREYVTLWISANLSLHSHVFI